MSLTTILLAFAPGIAARIKRPEINPDVEITRLKDQLAKVADDRDMWRDRALEAEEWQEAQWRQAQAQSLQNAANVQLAQSQVAQQQGFGQMGYLLGAQALQMPGDWCNCVPARHDMFLPRR
jgi:hypothetical protein